MSLRGGVSSVHNEENFRVVLMHDDGTPVTTSSPQPVNDDYALGEVLDDQSGADSDLEFTFTQPVVSFWVAVMGSSGIAKVDHYGGTPSPTHGIPVVSGTALPIPEPASVVRVYAPVGVVVTVWGQRRG